MTEQVQKNIWKHNELFQESSLKASDLHKNLIIYCNLVIIYWFSTNCETQK